MNCDVPQLWMDHIDALRGYIRKRVHDENEADDILQDVLIKVYNFCMTKSGVYNLRSWLFQIAYNTIVDWARKRQIVKETDQVPDIIDSNNHDAYKDAAEYIVPMIHFLPPKYAEPLRLADIEGMNQATIARQLGIGLSAAKSRIQRARQMLKEIFIECCLLETGADGKLISFDIRSDCKPLQQHKRNLKHL